MHSSPLERSIPTAPEDAGVRHQSENERVDRVRTRATKYSYKLKILLARRPAGSSHASDAIRL